MGMGMRMGMDTDQSTARRLVGNFFFFLHPSISPCGGFICIFICQIHYSKRACTKSQQFFFCACCRDTSTREWQSFQLFARFFR
jgi:hypothetical protein